MRHPNGTLVHCSRDALGLLEVVDHGHERALHFGTEPKQSAMDLLDPMRLTLSYTRAMVASLLFAPPPKRALVLGLGGGSLAKFLLHHFPACHLDAVEYRPEVARLAREFFQLPDAERLSLHIGDAGEFVRLASAQRFADYDVILVDAYDHAGMSGSVCGLSFFDACRLRLHEHGAMAINLWSGDVIRLEDTLDDLGRSFDGNLLRLPVEQKDNIIAIATQQTAPKKRLNKLKDQARYLQDRTGVEYFNLIRNLKRYNRNWII